MRITLMLTIYAAAAILALAVYCPILRRAADPKRKLSPLFVIPFALAVVLFAFPPIGSLIPNGQVCFFFQRIGNVFLGFVLYFFGTLVLVVLLSWIVQLICRRFHGMELKPSRRSSAALLAFLAVFSLAINVYGFCSAHDVRVTEYEIPKEKLGQDEPLRIVFVSDLHIGVNSTIRLYEDMVARINEQEPDMVLIGGDIFTSAYEAMKEPEEYARVLGSIRASKGVYAVYGNHDMEEPLLGGFSCIGAENAVRHPELPGFLEKCGWRILTDEAVTFPELNGLVLAGRRDLTRPGDGIKERMTLSELLKDVDPSDPVILLQHEPEDFAGMGEYGVDLSLSGHTHDGQVFPINIVSRLIGPQSYGIKEWGSAISVVTSGVGYFGPPIRPGTVSEITVIDIR